MFDKNRFVSLRACVICVGIVTLLAFDTDCGFRLIQGEFERSLCVKIQRICVGVEPCVIDLKELGPPMWERGYVFGSGVTSEEAATVVGRRLKEFPELSTNFVFVSGETVVGQEHSIGSVERCSPGEVVFADGGNKHVEFTPADRFEVTKDRGCYSLRRAQL